MQLLNNNVEVFHCTKCGRNVSTRSTSKTIKLPCCDGTTLVEFERGKTIKLPEEEKVEPTNIVVEPAKVNTPPAPKTDTPAPVTKLDQPTTGTKVTAQPPQKPHGH